MALKKSWSQFSRALDARPDTTDFRDRGFVPALIDVPTRLPLEAYLEVGVPVLDQGQDGGCTGFGLATVVQYLLRHRRPASDQDRVSPRMLYEMAKKFDIWPGETYEGTSARGTLKGWRKHGVCTEEMWLRRPDNPHLTWDRAEDAERRPLGSYLRIDREDIFSMQAALKENGVLYATSLVHEGWIAPPENGWIDPGWQILGGHSFAIVGYEPNGFWIQNSWGSSWARGGRAFLRYGDWLEHGTDVWVARLGSPVAQPLGRSGERGQSLPQSGAHKATTTSGWQRRRLLLYVQGGAWARRLQPPGGWVSTQALTDSRRSPPSRPAEHR